MLLTVIGTADVLLPAMHLGPTLALGLGFVMGVQNAATSRISNARVRTTHVSGMATDIGLGLAALAHRSPDGSEAVARMKLYLLTIATFALGGVLGVIVYVRAGGVLFLLAAALLLTMALPEVRRARRLTE